MSVKVRPRLFPRALVRVVAAALVVTVLLIAVGGYFIANLAAPSVALGTMLLALGTAWLALEARAERRQLREQYEAATHEARKSAREAEVRQWAIELRKRLSAARNATITFANHMVNLETGLVATSDAAEYYAKAWRQWRDRWIALQDDLFAYMDLSGVLSDEQRRASASALTSLQQAGGKGSIPKHARTAADKFVEAIDNLNRQIDERFDLRTTLRTQVGAQQEPPQTTPSA